MTIKELKEYLENFDNGATVAVGLWKSDGQHFYTPHAPSCKPVEFIDGGAGARIAVVGFMDDCRAHEVNRP